MWDRHAAKAYILEVEKQNTIYPRFFSPCFKRNLLSRLIHESSPECHIEKDEGYFLTSAMLFNLHIMASLIVDTQILARSQIVLNN